VSKRLELSEYRVKPARGYGTTNRVILVAMVNYDNRLPRDVPRLEVEYENELHVVYNPQKLSFDVNTIISAIKTIKRDPLRVEVVND